MDLWLRIKSMNLTRKLEEIDNRKIGLATIRHCKLRGLDLSLADVFISAQNSPGFSQTRVSTIFDLSSPSSSSVAAVHPLEDSKWHTAHATRSLCWRRMKKSGVYCSTERFVTTQGTLKDFHRGFLCYRAHSPTSTNKKKNISVEFLRVRLRFHHQKQSNYTSCFLAPRLIQPDDGTGSFVETTKIIFILISIWFIVQWLRNVFACNCIYCLL